MCFTLAPSQVAGLLDKLHSTRQHLHQMWHVRKLKLDQCFQLRLFEQDAEKVQSGTVRMDETRLLLVSGSVRRWW